ncbi:MAG TPA: hypothetical protein VGJ20_02600 [Xanthobacteraceae bacterium]|jgi:hypothetical protein
MAPALSDLGSLLGRQRIERRCDRFADGIAVVDLLFVERTKSQQFAQAIFVDLARDTPAAI